MCLKIVVRAIHQRRPVRWGGGGGQPKLDDRGRGGVGCTLDVQKIKQNWCLKIKNWIGIFG